MASYTQGDTRPVLQPADLATYQSNGSVVLDSRRTRPLWFDGRFLAARDLEREQDYFLQREADLARAPGYGVIQGLWVDILSSSGQTMNAQAITIQAGQGVTPAGELVSVPSAVTVQLSDLVEEEILDVQFGISPTPPPDPMTRTGLYVIALKPVQFTANPITSYPTTIQGTRTTHDGDMVEATAVALVPYPGPANNNNAATAHAALARQIFVTGSSETLPDSLLPLAMLSLQGGAIEWVDPYMVRRETGLESNGLQFGLTNPATQQAFLLEYDTQLQQVVNSLVRQKLPTGFSATDYLQALPPAGRFPLACISTDGFTQSFFPPQMDVRLSVVPEDELAALIEDSMSLPPIDLTLDPGTYTNLSVFALVPVRRSGFAELSAGLPSVQLTTVLPQVLNNRKPLELLQFYRGVTGINQPSATENSSWQAAFGTQTYGYYIRRRSSAPLVSFKVPPPPPQISSVSPSSATAGGPAFTLTIGGSNFSDDMAVLWDTTALSAAYVNPGLLTAAVPASFIAQQGSASIVARNPFQPSNAVIFTIGPAKLTITSISPASALAGGPAFTLTANGVAFSSDAKITWNGTPLNTAFVSSTQLTAAVPANLISSVGTASVGIVASNQPSSAAVPFIIAAPLVLSAISPATVASGSPGLTLIVTGSGFSSGAFVTWNGTELTTVFVSATQLNATVPANLLGSAASVSVGVSAPNQTSATVSFVITQGFFVSSVSPSPIPLNVVNLTVIGGGFTASTQILWNGNPLLATFVSASQMTVTVPTSLLGPGAVISFSARNGNVTSNAVSVPISTAVVTTSATTTPAPAATTTTTTTTTTTAPPTTTTPKPTTTTTTTTTRRVILTTPPLTTKKGMLPP